MSKYVPLQISKEDLDALDSAHDDVVVFRGPEISPFLCVIRRPSFEESVAYKEMAGNPAKKSLANVKLITAISVFPKNGTPEWKAQFDRFPFFPDGVADSEKFKEFVGLSNVAAEK